MNKKLLKGFLALFLLGLFLVPMMGQAQGLADPSIYGLDAAPVEGMQTADDIDLQEAGGSIIGFVLGFLGLIAVAVILIGGFKWMLSGGNEEKVSGAKKMLIAGLIGLVIVIFAWAIVSLVVNTATGEILV